MPAENGPYGVWKTTTNTADEKLGTPLPPFYFPNVKVYLHPPSHLTRGLLLRWGKVKMRPSD